MKKFSFISSVCLLVLVVAFLFIGCQKESAVTEEDQSTLSVDAEKVSITEAGSQSVIGLISKDHADKMSAAFTKKHPSVITTSVGYSTKNLIAYLSTLLVKQKSDSVFLSFGLYDKETAPKSSYIGRSTIFFMGKNSAKSQSGSTRLQSEDEENSKTSNYLNGGQLIP